MNQIENIADKKYYSEACLPRHELACGHPLSFLEFPNAIQSTNKYYSANNFLDRNGGFTLLSFSG